ncbi:MAG: FGGY family carbohydrate kinase [Thomasclavelia ramosa]
MLENVDGARELANQNKLLFGTVDTWLIYNLTGGKIHVTDYTNASRTMLFDIHQLCWDDDY